MSKKTEPRHPTRQKPARRSRGEIDRNYFFGDVLIKAGIGALAIVLLIATIAPMALAGALQHQDYQYPAVLIFYVVVGLVLYLIGRHLRHEATHWDFD